MKKFTGWLFIAMLAFTACEGPEGPPGKDGLVSYWKNIDFTITRDMWQLVGDVDEIGSYYSRVFDIPELTEAIYFDGGVLAYYRYTNNRGIEVQTPLPFTWYNIYLKEGVEQPYSVQFSYDVTPTVTGSGGFPGTIEFKVTFSDFVTDRTTLPEYSDFRLTLLFPY